MNTKKPGPSRPEKPQYNRDETAAGGGAVERLFGRIGAGEPASIFGGMEHGERDGDV